MTTHLAESSGFCSFCDPCCDAYGFVRGSCCRFSTTLAIDDPKWLWLIRLPCFTSCCRRQQKGLHYSTLLSTLATLLRHYWFCRFLPSASSLAEFFSFNSLRVESWFLWVPSAPPTGPSAAAGRPSAGILLRILKSAKCKRESGISVSGQQCPL